MKKFLTILLLLFCMIGCSSCGWIEYAGYPWLKVVQDEENGEYYIVYKGAKYWEMEEIVDDSTWASLKSGIWIGGYYFNYEKREIVGTVVGFLGGRYPIYADPADENARFLEGASVMGSGCSYWVREGFEFELPDMYTTNIDAIFLQTGWYSYDTGIREYMSLAGVTTFFDLIDTTVEAEKANYLGDYCCYLELEEFDFLKVGNFQIGEIDDTLYLCGLDYFKETDERKYYKIKDEYQEIFRNTIEKLSEKQSNQLVND